MKKLKSLFLMAAINVQDFAFVTEIPLGPEIKIKYHSRTLADVDLGIGWSLENKAKDGQSHFIYYSDSGYVQTWRGKNQQIYFYYHANQLMKIESADQQWDFGYDEFSNLVLIKKRQKPLLQINYDNKTDTVLSVTDAKNKTLWQRGHKK